MTNQDKVREFMAKAGQPTPEAILEEPDEKTKALRISLLMEELLELAKASGVQVSVGYAVDIEDFEFNVIGKTDIVEVADALADIEYVMHGASVAYGLKMQPIFDVVHESNMAKFGPGGYRNAVGKWIKPPDWQKPDISALLDEQRTEDEREYKFGLN
jgi:predicted HAD superfamily Cof-like phosphohydrolase